MGHLTAPDAARRPAQRRCFETPASRRWRSGLGRQWAASRDGRSPRLSRTLEPKVDPRRQVRGDRGKRDSWVGVLAGIPGITPKNRPKDNLPNFTVKIDENL